MTAELFLEIFLTTLILQNFLRGNQLNNKLLSNASDYYLKAQLILYNIDSVGLLMQLVFVSIITKKGGMLTVSIDVTYNNIKCNF